MEPGDTLVGYSWDNLVEDASCGTPLWDTLAGDALVGHSYSHHVNQPRQQFFP